MEEKLTAKQYLEEKRRLTQRIDDEEFGLADNYLQAAMRLVQGDEVRLNRSVICTIGEVAIRLSELYPEGLPLTFVQLAEMRERDVAIPPNNDIIEWWAGRI